MSGAHAELFTFCLYQDLLPKEQAGEFAPLEMGDYYSPNGIDVEPGIRFHWSFGDDNIYFDIDRQIDGFILYVQLNSLENHSLVADCLQNEASFAATETSLSRLCDPDEIVEAIEELRSTLVKLS